MEKRQVRTIVGPGQSFKGAFLSVLETYTLVVSYETDEMLFLPWEHTQEIGKWTCLKSEVI